MEGAATMPISSYLDAAFMCTRQRTIRSARPTGRRAQARPLGGIRASEYSVRENRFITSKNSTKNYYIIKSEGADLCHF
jgi:hypothetical protein